MEKQNNPKTNFEYIRQKAEKLHNQKFPKAKAQISEADILRLLHELEVHQIELELMNEELRLSKENEAKLATSKYIELFDFAPIGYFTLSKDGSIIELNLSGANLLGRERSLLINNRLAIFISENSRPSFNLFLKRVFNNKVKEECELTLSVADRVPTYIYLNGIATENGEHCLITIVDISKRKEADEKLKELIIFNDQIINSAYEGVIVYDYNMKYLIWNPYMEKLTGLPAAEVLGKQPLDLFPFLKDAGIIEIINKAFQGEISGGLDFPFRILSNGKTGWVSDITGPLLNAKGEIIGAISTVRDITERKLAEHLLKVSEEKYKTMLNSSPDGILLINMEGIITEVSDIGLELFGAEIKDDLVGKYFYLFVTSDEINTLKDIFEKAMTEGLAQNIELKIKKRNQSIFAAETSATLIQESDGTPLSFMLIIRDISQRRKMETKQIHADRMANLGEMASGIAHEINQPLNTISMVMDKILFVTDKTQSIDIEFLKDKSDIIFENITRIRNIIDHIRAFSRSHDDFLLTAFKINLSIENAASMMMEQFKHLGIKLNLQLDKQIPQIVGNTYKFEQVIVNLLTNAKDAVLEKKSKQVADYDMNVEIRSFQENQFLIVEISDNGIGVSKDDIHNIMLPFYTTKDEGKGTGLGLSICYQIIKELNGTIDITSEIFRGTKIRLVLEIENKK